MIYVQYLIAASSILCSIGLSVLNAVLMGYMLQNGNSVVHSLLGRQVTCSILLGIFFLWTKSNIKSKYWKLHLIRSMGSPVAALLWGKAIANGVPLSVCGFMSLFISVSSMIIARFTLNEKWPRSGWGLVLSVIPITYDLFYSDYRFGVLLLLINSIIYGLLDSVNVYIMKPEKTCPMQRLITHRGIEKSAIINLYDHIGSLVFCLSVFAFSEAFRSNSYTIQSQARFIPYYIIMGVALASTMPLTWFAYSIKDISSMQFLRITEPILSGIFGDAGPTPIHILIGTLLFGLTSLLEITMSLGLF